MFVATMKLSCLVALSSLALVSSNPSAEPAFHEKCAALSRQLTNKALGFDAKIHVTEFVTAGSNVSFPDRDPSCSPALQPVSVDLCRIALNVTTSPRSQIKMEAWFPSNWTGRFLATGNGGVGGCIQYDNVEYAASLGFAAVGSNNGHEGSYGRSFVEPETVKDFVYRSLHTSVEVGKKISKIFYGKNHSKSYYLGCSTGGRQGFKAIENYPKDFDGVIAGAPATAWNNLTAWDANFYPLTGKNDSTQFIPFSLWTKIAADVLDQCDTIDGVADRVIEDPEKCDYDAGRLACRGGNASDCLTPAQVHLLRTLLFPLFDPIDGSLVYPRMQPGAELESAARYYHGQPFFTSDWYKYAIKKDPNWDPLTLNVYDWHESQKADLFGVHTWSGDLSKFEKSGGKVLVYHGLQDGLISSTNSARFYEHVSKTMNRSPKQLDNFFRYFPISGFGHCSGGNGAAFMGSRRQTYAGLAPEDNVVMATVKWVEQGVGPDFVRGTKYLNDKPSDGVQYQRNHCKWPARAFYKGTGDSNSVQNWGCR